MTTYKDAGVNIEATDAIIEDISSFSKETSRIGAMNKIGGFAGIFDLKKCGYTDPLLITSTDGIGTKILLGVATGLLDGLGYDLVGMCLNDTVCHGADPLFFLDYYASSKIDKVSFTGSIKTGKKIAQICGSRLIPYTLELGGNDAMLVCSDADIDKAVDGALIGSCMNTGQYCCGTERIYVHQKIYDEFLNKVIEKAKTLKQSGQSDPLNILRSSYLL